MALRIWHQSMSELDDFHVYRQALEAHARQVVRPDTEVVLHGLPTGTYGGMAPADVLLHPYPYHLTLTQVVENVYQAEREGFDAVALASYSEPFLREARSIVDIPVASMAESTLLVGCSVARQMALITITAEIARMTRVLVEKHGLEKRVSGIYVLEPPMNEVALGEAFGDPAAFLHGFTATAERAIEAGADLVVPAEGVLNELLFANGVQKIGEVPVMDCVGVLFSYAEMLVTLRRTTGLTVGRRWEYSRPKPEVVAHVRRRAGLPT